MKGDTDAAIRRLLELGPEAVIEKRGDEGARIHLRDGQTTRRASCRGVQHPRRGDAFGADPVRPIRGGLVIARRLGNACGAIVVTKHGCANFMPTLDEVMAFVEGYGGLD